MIEMCPKLKLLDFRLPVDKSQDENNQSSQELNEMIKAH